MSAVVKASHTLATALWRADIATREQAILFADTLEHELAKAATRRRIRGLLRSGGRARSCHEGGERDQDVLPQVD